MQLVVYPGAHHEFDWANSPVRLRTGLVNTVDPSGKAHGGTNPAARNDALKRVPQWLREMTNAAPKLIGAALNST